MRAGLNKERIKARKQEVWKAEMTGGTDRKCGHRADGGDILNSCFTQMNNEVRLRICATSRTRDRHHFFSLTDWVRSKPGERHNGGGTTELIFKLLKNQNATWDKPELSSCDQSTERCELNGGIDPAAERGVPGGARRGRRSTLRDTSLVHNEAWLIFRKPLPAASIG